MDLAVLSYLGTQITYSGLGIATLIYIYEYIAPNEVAPESYAYSGSAIALLFSQLAAAYAVAEVSSAAFINLPKYYEYGHL
jgi:hypothetical protein